MPTSISSSTSMRAVVPKNGTTGNSVKSAFLNCESSPKSQSDAVLPKNGSILINTINETDKETINDTTIGFAQQTDEKKQKEILGDFLKKIPPDPLKTFHCVQRAKKCSGFFCLA